MHGLGNDFLVVNNITNSFSELEPEQVVNICQRRFGVGADGILVIYPPQNKQNDCKVIIHNADGSQAEMCGNGIRCVSHYLALNDITKKDKQTIETAAGLIKPEILDLGYDKAKIKVNLGKPSFSPADIPLIDSFSTCAEGSFTGNIHVEDENFKFTAVSMGNPHAVFFLSEDPEEFPVSELGPKIENHRYFPEKTNVEFAQIVAADKIKVRVWERGSGLTLACGTGAAATLAAAVKNQLANREALLNLPGGNLEVSWPAEDIFIIGPSEVVYQGQITNY